MVTAFFVLMAKRGRPRKIKTLEQYTISELTDMPMGSMVKLFVKNVLGKKSVVTSPQKIQHSVKKEKVQDSSDTSVVADLMDMTLEKKADYLADALMGYLKKAK